MMLKLILMFLITFSSNSFANNTLKIQKLKNQDCYHSTMQFKKAIVENNIAVAEVNLIRNSRNLKKLIKIRKQVYRFQKWKLQTCSFKMSRRGIERLNIQIIKSSVRIKQWKKELKYFKKI